MFFLRGNPEKKDFSEVKRKLERDLALQVKECKLQVKECKALKGQINELNRAYTAVDYERQQALIEIDTIVRQHGDRIDRLNSEHAEILRERDANHGDEVKRLGAEHRGQIQKLETNYGQLVESLKSSHKREVEDIETKHNQQVNQLDKEVQKLKGQLMFNQDGNQGWPDDKLETQFKQLQRLIESLTSPRNKEFVIPPNQQAGPQLDPTNFLGRAGRGKSHFMLKSIIWAIFQEQFFSAPFGFGALGPGKGQRELLDVYLTWQKSFGGGAGTASPTNDGFAIFHQDELANNWRSANFRSINAVLTGGGKRNPAPDSPLAKLSADNVQQTVDRILAVLYEVSRLSNSLVRSEVEDEIHKIANIARELALQFGVHKAQLRLSVPHRGTQIQIGDEFHDCEDGDFQRGMICRVDLVTFPGLERIGDGRSDMKSKQIITPCEIYPNQQHS